MPTPEPPPPVSQEFFTEEFNSDPGWFYDVIVGHGSSEAKNATYQFNFGQMIFDITNRDLYAYYIYEGRTYEDTRLDIQFENRGVNSQQVSLICRMGDEGWYEFSVQSDGLWVLYAVIDGRYNAMANGGSTAVRIGKEVNEYTFICEDNKLSFLINGVEPKGSPYTDRKFVLRRGNVGFSVSSLRATPVKVEVDWFKVSPP
jgi:hypothetical protein